jgi:hypothetical protein
VFSVQHHAKLCSKCSTSLVSSSNVSPVCWKKRSHSWWLSLLPWQSLIWFYSTCCSTCCQATQIVEIFHIILFLLILHNRYWRWLFWDSNYLIFIHCNPCSALTNVSRLSCNTVKSNYQYFIIILTNNSRFKVFLSNLRVSQSVNEFHRFCGTRSLITIFTGASNLPLP